MFIYTYGGVTLHSVYPDRGSSCSTHSVYSVTCIHIWWSLVHIVYPDIGLVTNVVPGLLCDKELQLIMKHAPHWV